MIVTFHLTILCAYRIWETYISKLFWNSDNRAGGNTGNGNVSPGNASNFASVPDIPQNNDINQQLNNELPSNDGPKSETRQPMPAGRQQSKDGKGDLPQIVKLIHFQENEEGRKFIYDVEPTFKCTLETEGIRFSPPVYMQRYMIIEDVLKQPCWAKSIKKVVDFGCAELSFEVRCLKKLFSIHEILCVDKDRDLLDNFRKKVCPTPTDFLQCRPSPLTIKVLCGSIANTHEILVNTDAVIAIELIEHLFPGDLECLPFTVFGFIKPKLAMFTTPNADFNVLFPGFSGFRHDDHKFEWSREQFEDWCNNLVQRYKNYRVTFQGIGPGPAGTEHLGCCSQMATFIKETESQSLPGDEIHVQDGPYELVEEFDYPYFVDTRTRDEIMKDEAIFFLSRCASIRRFFAERDDSSSVEAKEVPLSVVMERVKCFSIVKLRDILTSENWEVRTNTAGNEVVVLPDSDYSSSETSEDIPETDTFECESMLPYEEENWDCDETVEPTYCLDCTQTLGVSLGSIFTPDESMLCSTNVSADLGNVTESKTTMCNSSIVSTNDTCGLLQDSFVNDVSCELNSSCNSSTNSVTQNDEAVNHSVYETPQSSGWRGQCVSKDIPSNHQSIGYECNEHISDNTLTSIDLNMSSNVPSSGNLMSPFDVSTYSTPCSQLHRTQISKCISLQQINSDCPTLQIELKTSTNHKLIKDQKDQVSKSMEGLRNQESFEIPESCSINSKIVDSGYPDSYSDHDMDLDLTPEQFDDIDTESDENISGSLPSPLVPAPQGPLVIDDVENGDVANNNRDGEGNNLIADMEEEPIEFEAQIVEEFYHEVPNFEGADVLSRQEFDKLSEKKESLGDQICVDSYDQQPQKTYNNSGLESENFYLVNNTEFITKPTSLKVNISTDKNLKTVKSDTSTATSDSWSQIEFPENHSLSNNQENSNSSASKENNITSHNSLTTVLDGYSTFSDCSIVKPIDKISSNELEEEINTNSRFPKSFLKIEGIVFENEGSKEETKCSKVNELQHLNSSLQKDNKSVPSLSEYRSAESLNSRADEEMFEISDFPAWLLSIDCDVLEEVDHDSSSVFSLLDNESYEELLGLNFDVPVDSRGGGDPQGDTVVNFPVNM